MPTPAASGELRERVTSLRFEHELVQVPGLDPESVVALGPILRQPGSWWMLDRAGRMRRVDLDRAVAEPGGALPDGALDRAAKLDLHVAPDGRLVAVAERSGRHAVVLEPASGRVAMSLLRDDYYQQHCRFPLAFLELGGRLLLVHGTKWNRLEVSDPATGMLLTARSPLLYESGAELPDHYLDYFHAGLSVSPDGRHVIDDGWMWHPVGIVRVFSLERWVNGNPFESEDGSSVKELCNRAYFWDGPVCWLDERTVAVWGAGDDADELTPAARIFDVETGEEVRSFVGPAAGFVWDPPYLVAHDETHGAAVWNPVTGERLAQDPSLKPQGYHPGSGCFVTRMPGEGFRVSRRTGDL